jgi:hypothetical protein
VTSVERAQFVPRADGQPFGVEDSLVGEFEADLPDARQRNGVFRLDPGLKADGDGDRVVSGKSSRRNASPKINDQVPRLRSLAVDGGRDET